MCFYFITKTNNGGAWVVLLVKRPTLGFGSGPDLRVVRSSPMTECRACLSFSISTKRKKKKFLSFPLPLPPCLLAHAFSLSQK